MGIFMDALEREIDTLREQGVRLRIIGDRSLLAVRMQARIADAEARTQRNEGLKLQVAVSYGGRWDLIQAARRLARAAASGALRPEDIDESRMAAELALTGLPDPDLFIRTGGEQRISNFLLWNLAYTELWFTDVLWPEFTPTHFDAALDFFARRDRRFGLTCEQVRA
jgi:undecaprenyl diphosphate synthase